MLPHIRLDRRFFEWQEKEHDELSDPDLLARFGLSDGTKSWDDLLNRRRVVVLAEAGSGKTEEMKEQTRRLKTEGKAAFYATVQDVGRLGLDSALSVADRSRLSEWHSSNQHAIFLIDSIDEAKLDGIRLERALSNLADGIFGAEGRAHIILSGRHTDWQFRHDLRRLNDILPVPLPQPPQAPTAEEFLIRILRHEQPPQDIEVEKPLVVILASLDARRVRLFADGKDAPEIDSFLAEIDAANLWRFARRPIDLDWLVQFWKTNRRLGTLTEMLTTSLRERLRESDPDRDRRDPIDSEHAMQAIERIGAALVFGRATTLAIPDSEITLSETHISLDIAEVLPDWSASDRLRLLDRPVFDPATFGRTRLHNDNEGVVRGFLAASWLRRLRALNLSRERLFEFLFANTYDVPLVIPSVQETAAWLAIWDSDVAREVIDREPYLLLTAGDPASLLPDVRMNVLTRLIERVVANDERVPLLDYDSVKRFARTDIAPVIRRLWPIHKSHPEARNLLLRLIWLGELRQCADIAAEAVEQNDADRRERVVASRAFLATADEVDKRRYAERVISECRELPNTIVWDAIELLFPGIISVDDLLLILDAIDITDRDGGVGFQWQAPDLIERLNSTEELERLLAGLDALLGPEPDIDRLEEDDRQEALLVAAAAAAFRQISLLPDNIAPDAVIDAAVRIGRHLRYGQRSIWKKVGDCGDELRKTAARRRLSFWRAAEICRSNRMLQSREIENVWELDMLGWHSGLQPEDISWLLADAAARARPNECRLGVNAALHVWNQVGRPEALLSQIETSARAVSVMNAAFEAWMNPPLPNPALIEQERELRRLQREGRSRRAETDQSWSNFANEMRANPTQLRQLNPATTQGVDARLFNLWELLRAATSSRSHYGLDSVAPIEPIVGPEVAGALRDGLIQHWRDWTPTRISAREERNRISSLDTMGIAGITMEAASANWANGLTPELAERATVYATLELNGFPKWTADLSSVWPQQVRNVLTGEIIAELDEPEHSYGVLRDVARADSQTTALMVPLIIGELEQRPDLDAKALLIIVDIVEHASSVDQRGRLLGLALERFNNAQAPALESLYIALAFRFNPEAATEALMRKIDGLASPEQTQLVQNVLPHIFGSRFSDRPASPGLSLHVLDRLVCLSFRTIRVEDDNQHPSGVAYTPDERDDAESARNAALKQLSSIPGRATFNTLMALAEVADFPIPPRRLREIARSRAGEDSEFLPWPPSEAHAFEARCELLPQTSCDLQRLLLGRLADVQHGLLHDDFAQGSTLAVLPHERDVQIWMADRLQTIRGRSYTIEREPHVVEETEPDIRARAANDSRVQLEIKVAESWSLAELEHALTDQLCGRYLRARGGRHGILLLVHQKPRPFGWAIPSGRRYMGFDEVVVHLRAKAKDIAGATSDAPQPVIAVIDVSTCANS